MFIIERGECKLATSVAKVELVEGGTLGHGGIGHTPDTHRTPRVTAARAGHRALIRWWSMSDSSAAERRSAKARPLPPSPSLGCVPNHCHVTPLLPLPPSRPFGYVPSHCHVTPLLSRALTSVLTTFPRFLQADSVVATAHVRLLKLDSSMLHTHLRHAVVHRLSSLATMKESHRHVIATSPQFVATSC